MKTFRLMILVLSAIQFSIAQTENFNENCPTIAVSGPLMGIKTGETASFSVSISSETDAKKVQYVWTVEGGNLVSGQGTNRITAEISGDAVATIDLKGIQKGCSGKASFTVAAGEVKSSPIFFDEFSKVKDKLLERRIAAFADALSNTPGANGYLISYGPESQVRKREESITGLLSAHGRVVSTRIIFTRGGDEKEVRTRVWIVPSGFDAAELN